MNVKPNRSGLLNVSQEHFKGDLVDKKNTNENSPRVSRNASLLGARDKTSSALAGLTSDNEKSAIKENMTLIEQNPLAKRVFTHVA